MVRPLKPYPPPPELSGHIFWGASKKNLYFLRQFILEKNQLDHCEENNLLDTAKLFYNAELIVYKFKFRVITS